MTNYRLVVCEKPSVAASIAAVLDAKKREDGFLTVSYTHLTLPTILRV